MRNGVSHGGMHYPIGKLAEYPLSRVRSAEETHYEIEFEDPLPGQPGRLILKLTVDQARQLGDLLTTAVEGVVETTLADRLTCCDPATLDRMRNSHQKTVTELLAVTRKERDLIATLSHAVIEGYAAAAAK